MIRKTTEERIFVQTDKILAMEENVKALSWSRVAEVGRALQSPGLDDDQRREYGRELISIANANVSMAAKLEKDFTGTGAFAPVSPDIARAERNEGHMLGVEDAKRDLKERAQDNPLPDPDKTFFFNQADFEDADEKAIPHAAYRGEAFASAERFEVDGTAAEQPAKSATAAASMSARASSEGDLPNEPSAESQLRGESVDSEDPFAAEDPFEEQDAHDWQDKTAAIDYSLLEQLVETFEPMIDPHLLKKHDDADGRVDDEFDKAESSPTEEESPTDSAGQHAAESATKTEKESESSRGVEPATEVEVDAAQDKTAAIDSLFPNRQDDAFESITSEGAYPKRENVDAETASTPQHAAHVHAVSAEADTPARAADPHAAEGEPSITFEVPQRSSSERAAKKAKEEHAAKKSSKKNKKKSKKKSLSTADNSVNMSGSKSEEAFSLLFSSEAKAAPAASDDVEKDIVEQADAEEEVVIESVVLDESVGEMVSEDNAVKGGADEECAPQAAVPFLSDESQDADEKGDDMRDETVFETPEEEKAGPSAASDPTDPGAFKMIYTSRDGRMCLFEDEAGHITAVNSDRLA